jgi:hypothetical protein
MWNNMMDNIFFYHRPYKISDPKNPLCIFRSSKIRWKKIVGEEGDVEMMYEFKRRRFYINGLNPLDDNPFNFATGEVVFNVSTESPIHKKSTNPYKMLPMQHEEILLNTFGDEKDMDKKEFIARLKQTLQKFDYPISKSAEYRDYYVINRMILTNDDNKFYQPIPELD